MHMIVVCTCAYPQDLYDQEKMYQCKADLLRLEVLWREGGIYIDADMVWLHHDLQDVLDACKSTGFFCGYEPDTKDKPYSVIGNSFIAATPGHPLVDMLIKYIKGIYAHKRPYHGVEWVTGTSTHKFVARHNASSHMRVHRQARSPTQSVSRTRKCRGRFRRRFGSTRSSTMCVQSNAPLLAVLEMGLRIGAAC